MAKSSGDGRLDREQKDKPGADLVEVLAQARCRRAEATVPPWTDMDLDDNALIITVETAGISHLREATIGSLAVFRGAIARGKTTRKVVPVSAELAISMLASSSSHRRFTMDRPTPSPGW